MVDLVKTGRYPERLKPINVKSDIDSRGEFRSVRELNQEIRRLNLAAAVRSIIGKTEECAVASLFKTGGTQARKDEFAGVDDFEVIAYLVVLPADASGDSAGHDAGRSV